MFHHNLNDKLEVKVLLKWFSLSFMAGNINAGGFLAAERFVSHVTGFATLFGIEAASGRWDQALGILSVPVFFLCGSIVSAYLVDSRFHRGHRPHYDWVMLLVFTCLVAVAFGGQFNMFGVFGEALRLKQDYFLLALLCLASGLQNAAITTASGASVRTTHLTGITTDLGIGIVRVLSTTQYNSTHVKEARANWMRVGTITSFAVGSFVGAFLFLKLKYLGFLLPAAIAFYGVLQGRRELHRVD